MQSGVVPNEVMAFINAALVVARGRGLKKVECDLIEGIWGGEKYEEIAEASGHKVQYLKNTVGPALFRELRKTPELAEINKTSFQSLLEAQVQRGAGGSEVVRGQVVTAAMADSRLDLESIPVSGEQLYGRTAEVAQLKEWLQPGTVSLICVYGLGGFGKTTLVSQVVREVAEQYAQVIWVSLQTEQAYERVLEVILQRFVAQGGNRNRFSGTTALEQCIQWFRQSPCLLVLEDFHRVLPRLGRRTWPKAGEPGGEENWQAYREFLKQLNTTVHKSSIVVVSREQPQFFAQEDGSNRVHSLDVRGLDAAAIQQFLLDRKVVQPDQVQAETLRKLQEQSSGHPLVLKVSSARIRNLFGGDIAAFLNTGSLVYGGLKSIVAEELEDLLPLEKEVLYWLLINRDPVEGRTPISFQMLMEDILLSPLEDAAISIGDALDALIRRSLVDSKKLANDPLRRSNLTPLPSSEIYFTLHELIEESVCECFVKDMTAELLGNREDLYFLHHCALVKATSNDSIGRRQQREVTTLIVQQLRTRVLNRSENQKDLFVKLLQRARTLEIPEKSYLGSNIVELCRSLKLDLAGFDFSALSIRQANFRGVELHNVSFAGATVSDCVFNDIFGGVLCVCCSPDGSLLASSDTDGNISIWNYSSRELRIRFKAHTSWIFPMQFSPDGCFLISASEDQYCCVWHVETGKRVQCILAPKRLLALDLSPDGKQVAAAGEGGEIFLWNLENSQLVHTFKWNDLGLIWSCVFSPDGKSLVSAGADSAIWQWNLQDGTGIPLIQEPSIQSRALVYSPDGKYLARVSERNIIRVWDIEAKCDVAELKGHSQEIWTLIFGRDSNELISAGTDQKICLWNIAQQKQIRTFQGHDATIYSLAYQSKELEIVSGSADQSICFWDYFEDDVEKQKLNQLKGFSGSVRSTTFLLNQDHYCLISGGSDQLIYRWNLPLDISTFSNLSQGSTDPIIFPKAHSGFIWSVTASVQQDRLASAGDDGNIYLWDTNSGNNFEILQGHSWLISSLDFSLNGKRLVSGSMDATIRLWDLVSDDSLVISNAHSKGVRHVRFAFNETKLISCGNDGTIKLWDLDTHECNRTWEGHQSFVQFCDVSPDGNYLISCSDDKTIRLWLIDSAKEEYQFPMVHTAWIRGVCFSPDGRFFASCGEDGLVCLWNVETKDMVWINKHEDGDGVKCVAFSPDSKLLAAGSDDGTVRLWNVEALSSVPIAILHTVQPYRGLDITGADITNTQRQLLRRLGAGERRMVGS